MYDVLRDEEVLYEVKACLLVQLCLASLELSDRHNIVHNDLHMRNAMVDRVKSPGETLVYHIGEDSVITLRNVTHIVRIFDWDHAAMQGFDSQKSQAKTPGAH